MTTRGPVPARYTLAVRTKGELDAMRAAGQVVAEVLDAVRRAAEPGVRLRELDELAQTLMHERGGTPSFLGYRPTWAATPFNGALCLSPNEVVVHGRPSGRRLSAGDLLSIDCGTVVEGWNGDAAITVRIGGEGEADAGLRERDERLMEATEAALLAGVAAAVPDATLLDVAVAIDAVARQYGYAHLGNHGGHGIGRAMHEAPFVPNEPTEDAGRHRLRAGNTIAIEPMLLSGAAPYRLAKDGWSIVTRDKARATHFEHTVLVGEDGPELLTG